MKIARQFESYALQREYERLIHQGMPWKKALEHVKTHKQTKGTPHHDKTTRDSTSDRFLAQV